MSLAREIIRAALVLARYHYSGKIAPPCAPGDAMILQLYYRRGWDDCLSDICERADAMGLR